MKRTVNKVAIFGVALASIMALGCDNFLFGSKSGGDSSTPTPEWAQGFYNYPTGAENSRGTLKIKNTFADEVLGSVDWIKGKR
ncbi:hypothetical protein [Treponema endosymbiont of Eucomonympha sp.]|uniref:hypothetical protein n=1 Tax=Treponema endosymbiont of Eucomonympha sp. TaxID=1580831 RepID=UPI0007831171|nr:hypothetical protein [Treponema endosymbiont of Eucomonympha sp.]